jgi:hypothetical protein
VTNDPPMTRAFASVWSLVDFLARRLELRPATAPHDGSGRPTELRSVCRVALNRGRIRARVAGSSYVTDPDD